MEQPGSEVKAIKVKEIRRQKVYVPKSMTTNQVMKKYGLKKAAACTARKKGFFVKNYSRPQVCVDPSKFNVDLCYNIAGKVFWRNLSRDPVAMSIRDVLIQEAVNHAKRNSFYAEENPATGLQLPKSRREGEFREAYTKDELTTIFYSPMYLNAKFQYPYQYWLPLLGLFTAARLNELASLYLSDVRQEDSLWVIDINMNAPDKSTKTESSERILPIHWTLIDLGLIDYRNRLESRGEERLFPELPYNKFDGYGRKAGRWINTVFLAELGLKDKDKQKDFQSLRKTLTTHLERQGAEFFAIKQLDGHSVGDDITMKYYTQKYTPKEMMDRVLSKINYPLDFGRFKRVEWERVK